MHCLIVSLSGILHVTVCLQRVFYYLTNFKLKMCCVYDFVYVFTYIITHLLFIFTLSNIYIRSWFILFSCYFWYFHTLNSTFLNVVSVYIYIFFLFFSLLCLYKLVYMYVYIFIYIFIWRRDDLHRDFAWAYYSGCPALLLRFDHDCSTSSPFPAGCWPLCGVLLVRRVYVKGAIPAHVHVKPDCAHSCALFQPQMRHLIVRLDNTAKKHNWGTVWTLIIVVTTTKFNISLWICIEIGMCESVVWYSAQILSFYP